MGAIGNKSALIQAMAFHQTGEKPLPEPMLIKFYNTLWYHQATVS